MSIMRDYFSISCNHCYPNAVVQATESLNLFTGTEVVTLLVEVSEIRAGGEISDVLFNFSLPFNNTPNEVTLPIRDGKY